MRNTGPNTRSHLLRYGIREIVELAQQLGEQIPDFAFVGENIGDPIAKGWETPRFVRDILARAVSSPDPAVWGYTHSRGNRATRAWVAAYSRRFSPESRLDPEDVVFASGLGAAMSVLYGMLPTGARVLQPLPGYPAHLSMERYAAGAETLGYRLDPDRGWQPDLDHLEDQIRRHPEVAGVLLVNPNNPTGTVYARETLEAVLRLAERHELMLVSDESYFRMVFNGAVYCHLTGLAAGRAPLIVLRGVSKDVPWPGARCGWMEFHNLDLSASFRRLADDVKKRLLVEVCATSLPQVVLPAIYDHPEYEPWLARNNAEMERNSNMIADILGRTPGLSAPRIQGAFYLMPLFREGVLNARQSLPIESPAARRLIEQAVAAPNTPLDKRFAFYLLAATGICVVPASDFESPRPGFRVTALDRDDTRRARTYSRLAEAVGQYLASAE
jgi:aspartate/methionine/tyrosine aminotransferase